MCIRDSFLADTNTNPTDEGAGGNTPGLGVLLPDHLPAGMEEVKTSPKIEVSEEDRQKQQELMDKYSGKAKEIHERSNKFREARAGSQSAFEKYMSKPMPIGEESFEQGEPKPKGKEGQDFDQILAQAKNIGDSKGKEAQQEYLSQFDEHTQRKLTQYYFGKRGMEG